MKSCKRFTFLLILILLLGTNQQSTYAQIQTRIRLDSVSVQLLPEYTHPAVIVIYEINLDETLPLPQNLTINIPADAEIIAVINFTRANRPVELTYQEARFGKWKDLQFTATTHRIRIDFQDPNLVRENNHRAYEFQWLSIYPTNFLSVTVRQPLGASVIQSQPSLQRLAESPDEHPEYGLTFGNISAGELFTLSFSYNKDTGDPANPALPVGPARPIDQDASGRAPSPIGVILWMLVVGVVILTITGLYYLRFRLKEAEKFEHIGQAVGIMNPERQTFFCQECGLRANIGDSYCSNCGTELRKPTPFEQSPLK